MGRTLISQRLLGIGSICSGPPRKGQRKVCQAGVGMHVKVGGRGRDGRGMGYTLLEVHPPMVCSGVRTLKLGGKDRRRYKDKPRQFNSDRLFFETIRPGHSVTRTKHDHDVKSREGPSKRLFICHQF